MLGFSSLLQIRRVLRCSKSHKYLYKVIAMVFIDDKTNKGGSLQMLSG